MFQSEIEVLSLKLVCCFLRFKKLKNRGRVEDTRLEAKAKDTKKIQGQGQKLSRPRLRTQKKSKAKDRTSRGQGPRTQAQVFSKKKKNVFKKFFQVTSNSLAYPEFLIRGVLNHKSHEMTSSKFFQRGSFWGTNIL